MEGVEKETIFELNPDWETDFDEPLTVYEHGYGGLKPDVFEKEFRAHYEKKGFFKPENFYFLKSTDENKDVAPPFDPMHEDKPSEQNA